MEATKRRYPYRVGTLVPCTHCQRPCAESNNYTKRGLCYRCYKDPAIRAAHAPTSKYAHRGVSDRCGRQPLPGRPTRHPPGSPGKLRVLARRAARGEQLWHPGDARDWSAIRAAAIRLGAKDKGEE